MSNKTGSTTQIYYYNDGSKSCEYHYLNGLLHNVNGPAVIFIIQTEVSHQNIIV